MSDGIVYSDLLLEHGDMAVIMHGHRTMAVVRYGDDIHHMPVDVRIDYGQRADDPPLTLRRVNIKAGWTAEDFAKLGES